LQPNGWDGKTFSIVNGILLDKKFLNIIGHIQSVTMTSPKQTSIFTEETLTLSQEDFPANHTHPQESDSAKKMNAKGIKEMRKALVSKGKKSVNNVAKMEGKI
jgi:hypothetical protein